MKKIIFGLFFALMSTNLFAAQTQIAQVNGMMCIKCQKMVTEALQKASPDAEIKAVSYTHLTLPTTVRV